MACLLGRSLERYPDTQEIQAQARKPTSAQERCMLMNLFMMQYQDQEGEKALVETNPNFS